MNKVLEAYPCKFEKKCRLAAKYDLEKYACTHGGGVACAIWRRLTDREICPNERLRGRVQGSWGVAR
jgi:hypothetical protein